MERLITQIGYFMQKMFTHFEIKAVGSLGFAAMTFLFDSVLREAMLAILVLMIIDFATGMVAAWMSGEPIQSQKALRSAIKVAVYFTLVSAGKMTEMATGGIVPLIDEAILSFLAITELISILENAGKMGYPTPQKLLNNLKGYKNNY